MTNCGKLLERWEYQTILDVSWETYIQDKKQQLGPVWNNWLVQDQERNIVGLSAVTLFNLTYTESTSWEMLGWMSYKLESRQGGETSTTSDMWMIPL